MSATNSDSLRIARPGGGRYTRLMRTASVFLLLAVAAVVVAEPPASRVVLLDDGTLIEGSVERFDKLLRVTPVKGTARIVTTAQVAFVGDSKQAAYDHISGVIDGKTAVGARQLAIWCEAVGLPDQALLHAKVLVTYAPNDSKIRDWIARLEKQTATRPALVPTKKAPVSVEPANVELASGAAVVFASRIQPILSNQCASCHAAKDYAGPFKLNRTTEGFVDPEIAAANMKIVSTQLLPANPTASPLLLYARKAHGGQKRPAFPNPEAIAYRHLETWVLESLPPAKATTGFAKPPTNFEPKTESPDKTAEAVPVLPGAIVGKLGQASTPPQPATITAAPPAPLRAPVNTRDPFDPAVFNRMPKKSAK